MAEIKIEKKKPVWPWILLVLIIIGILVYFFVLRERSEIAQDYNGLSPETEIPEANDTTNYKTTSTDSSSLAFNRELEKYLVMINDKARLGNDVEFTRTALMQLTNTVEVTLKKTKTQIRVEHANSANLEVRDSITDSENLARDIKKTGEQIVSILESDKEQFPDLSMEIRDAKNAVEGVKPDLEISQQKENIVVFFERFGELMKRIEQEK